MTYISLCLQNCILSPITITRASLQSASKRVNDVLSGSYSVEYMASHSLASPSSDGGRQAWEGLDPVQEIISKYHMYRYKNKSTTPVPIQELREPTKLVVLTL